MPGRGFRAGSYAWRTAFRAATPSPTRSMRRTGGPAAGDVAACRRLGGRVGGGVVAIDGKALRRSFSDAASRSPPHLVRAFVGEARPVLGQIRVENGITAVPTLSGMPALKGWVVTADAMHTQRRTAQAITATGGDRIPAPKGNRGAPYEDMKPYLDDPVQDGNWQCRQDADGGHGRIGTRTAVSSTTSTGSDGGTAGPGWRPSARWSPPAGSGPGRRPGPAITS